MARNLRSAVLLRIALLSSAPAAVAVGCATSAEVDDEALDSDAGADSGKKDARAVDGAKGGDDDDDDLVGEKDSGKGDPTTDDDAGTGDGGKDAGDAGKDAGDAGDGGKDAGDAGEDAPSDGFDTNGGSVKPTQGEIVISEVMYNPSGTETKEEWIELHNNAATERDLSGLKLKDGASPVHYHTIRAGTVIAPGAYVVFASEKAGAIAAKVPAGVVVYDYNTGLDVADRIVLGNSESGSIVLLDGVTEIARAKYGSVAKLGAGAIVHYSAPDGVSIQLKELTYAGSGVAANWCYSPNAWVAGSDKGTPGAPSDCP